MGDPPPPEVWMRSLLDREGIRYEEQGLLCGHRIDFLIDAGPHWVACEPNGDRWHHRTKVMACDLIKHERLQGVHPDRAPDKPVVPLGVFWSRMKKNPQQVYPAIMRAITDQRLMWWDWGVPLSSLHPEASRKIRRMMRYARVR